VVCVYVSHIFVGAHGAIAGREAVLSFRQTLLDDAAIGIGVSPPAGTVRGIGFDHFRLILKNQGIVACASLE